MRVSYGSATTLDKVDVQHLYAYRYAVFVERLGWELPGAKNGLEIDQFDRPDTIHVMARNADGNVCGCARLLPTTRPYLLEEVFPQLMNGKAPPKSDDVWELSRFSSTDPSSNLASPIWICREVMAAAVKCAIEVGAKRLIAVTSRGVERILRRLGINWQPVGPSMRIGGHVIFAFDVEIDEKTITALGLCNLFSEV
jgi:acyl homoserine lactone synthase